MAKQEVLEQSTFDLSNTADWASPDSFLEPSSVSLENVDPDLQWLDAPIDAAADLGEQRIDTNTTNPKDATWHVHATARRSVSEPPGMLHDDGDNVQQRLYPPVSRQQIVFQRDGLSLGVPFQSDAEVKQESQGGVKRPRSQALGRVLNKRSKREINVNDDKHRSQQSTHHIQHQAIDPALDRHIPRFKHPTSGPRSSPAMQTPTHQLLSPFQATQPRNVLHIGANELQSIVAAAVREAILAVCKE